MSTTEVSTEPLTERGRRTRTRLLRAARSVFESRGYAGTRMQDVAEQADVSHGTVYTWFGSKEELLRALVADLRGQQSALTEPRADAVPPAAYARLRAANERFLASYATSARLLSVIEEASSADPSWSGVLEEMRQAYVDRTARALRRWQESGDVDADLDADTASVALTGMVEIFARRVVAADGSAPTPAMTDLITRLWAGAVGIDVPAAGSPARTQPTRAVVSPEAPQSQPLSAVSPPTNGSPS